VDPDSRRLRVTVTDGRGRPVRDGGLAAWLSAIAPARAAGEVAVALVSDARIRALNRQYRRQDKATDVLSFATAGGPRPAAAEAPLGDIVIASGVAARQAKAAGHSVQKELRVLSLHGLLHLLGYDHHSPEDRRRMARVEARLRRAGGLSAGLIERALRLRSGQARA
jgi:probable rRNA maturation factor